MESNTILVRVKQIRDEAKDIKSFELVSANGSRLPGFLPGSHIDVHVDDGLIRQYSLCNGPDETAAYLIAVKMEAASRGGSRGMHKNVKVGDAMVISAPRNNFSLVPDAARHVLVGGGIGITPLLSMARHLLADGTDFELHYFGRSVEHTAFHLLLAGHEFSGRVMFHWNLEPEADASTLLLLLSQRSDGAHLYLCGPGPFMDLVVETASGTWPAHTVHLEYFAADPTLLARPKGVFEVSLARSGGTYAVAEGESIVDVLQRHSIHVDVSCEQGVCGTCLTGVLSGTPDHRDMFLSNEEKKACNQMTLCVSRALSSKLVLDL